MLPAVGSTISKHIDHTVNKAKQKLNNLECVAWREPIGGQVQQTMMMTYKAGIRSFLEYAAPPI